MNPKREDGARELIERVNAAVQLLAMANDPESFLSAFVGGIVANSVGRLPDDYWARCMIVRPCGQPMCDCHLMREEQMKFLNKLREDWKLHATQSISA